PFHHADCLASRTPHGNERLHVAPPAATPFGPPHTTWWDDPGRFPSPACLGSSVRRLADLRLRRQPTGRVKSTPLVRAVQSWSAKNVNAARIREAAAPHHFTDSMTATGGARRNGSQKARPCSASPSADSRGGCQYTARKPAARKAASWRGT